MPANGVDIATLGVRVDFTDVPNATKAVDNFAAAGARAEKQAISMGRSTKNAAGEANLALQQAVQRMEAEFVQSSVAIKSAVAQGFLTPQEAQTEGRRAAEHYNRGLAEAIGTARSSGAFKVQGGVLSSGEAIREGSELLSDLEGRFKNVDSAGRRAGLGLGRLNNAMVTVAQQATGANAITGRLADTIGTFAIGTAYMVPVLAGIAAIGAAWEYVTRESREAKEEQERSLASLEALRQRQADEDRGPGGAAQRQVDDGKAAIERIESTIAGLRRTEAVARGGAFGGITTALVASRRISGLTEELVDMRAQVAAGERAVAEAVAAAASASNRASTTYTQTLAIETDARLRVLAATREGAEAGRSAQRELEREREIRMAIATATGAERDAALRLIETKYAAIRATDDLQASQRAAEESAKAAAEAAEEQRRLQEQSAAVSRDLDTQIDAEQRLGQAQLKGADALEAVNRELEREQALRDALAQAVPADIQSITDRVNRLYDLKDANADVAKAIERKEEKAKAAAEAEHRAQERARKEIERTTSATAEFERQAVSSLRNIAQAFGDVGRAVGGLVGDLLDAKIEFARASAEIAGLLKSGVITPGEAAQQQGQADATLQGGVAAAGLGAGVGIIGLGVNSILNSRKERQQAVQAAEEEWKRALDSYIDELADADRWARLEGQATQGARDALNALVETMVADLATRGSFGAEAAQRVRDQFAGASDSPEGLQNVLESLAAGGNADVQRLLDEYLAKLERIQEAREAEIALQEEDIAIRTLVAQGRTEDADALRRQYEEQRILTEATELGGDALAQMWQELFKVEEAARAAAKAEREHREEVERLRDRRQTDLDITARERSLRGDERGALEARLQAQAEAELNAAADRLAAGEIEIEMYNRIVAVITGEVTQALEDFDAAAKQAAQSAMESLELRLLAAYGLDEEVFRLRQKIEYQRAVNDGMDEEYLATLRQVHAAELSARARNDATRAEQQHRRSVEEATKAIDGASRALNAPAGFTYRLTRNRVLRELGPNRAASTAPASAGGGNVSIGTINIQTMPGQDTQQIAKDVTKQIGNQIYRKVRAGGYNDLTSIFEG